MTLFAQNISKSFPGPKGSRVEAVADLSLEVPAGQVVGLLGPNGAGKTTTLRMLAGLLVPESGLVEVNGHNMATSAQEARLAMGYLTASTKLYPRMYPLEFLVYFGALYGMEAQAAQARAKELAERFDMLRYADRLCGKLSTGEAQRVNLARVLMHNPSLLILDEPTLGLDVLSNRDVLTLIKDAKGEGNSVLFSTHQLSDAQNLCDYIYLMHRGRIVAKGTLSDLQKDTGQTRLEDVFLAAIGAGVS